MLKCGENWTKEGALMKRYKHSLRVNIETENGVIQKRVYGNTIEECVKKKNELMEKKQLIYMIS